MSPACLDCKHCVPYAKEEVHGCTNPEVSYRGVQKVVALEIEACRMMPDKCGPEGRWYEAAVTA